MTQPIVIEVDSVPAMGWRGPCLDPVAGQIAVLTRLDIASPGRLSWSSDDACRWHLQIAPSVQFWNGQTLMAENLIACWRSAGDHPLGWSLAPILTPETSIEIDGPTSLKICLPRPLCDLPERLTGLWLWPAQSEVIKALHLLPNERGALIRPPAGASNDATPTLLWRTDKREDGLHLWEAGLLHATATTGHDASTVAKLRENSCWREDWTEIVATLLIYPAPGGFPSALAGALSATLDRQALVAAAGGMGDALSDPFEAHLEPEARQNCIDMHRGDIRADPRQETVSLAYADFPPNGAVCAELVAQLTEYGLPCRAEPLSWMDYLSRLRTGNWSLLYALMPVPWPAPSALPAAILRSHLGQGATVIEAASGLEDVRRIWKEQGFATVLFSLRSGSLLRGPASSFTFDRWGSLVPKDGASTMGRDG